MSLGFWFWLLWVLSLLFGGWTYWRTPPAGGPFWRPAGMTLIIWILFGLLGYAQFGGPVK